MSTYTSTALEEAPRALIHSKLEAPVPRQRVSRRELLELCAGSPRKLTLIRAPAGRGKSTVGQPGWDLFRPWEDREAGLEALRSAGEKLGLRQSGGRAYSSNTVEWGGIQSPLPAVYSRESLKAYREWLRFDHDFVGRDALEELVGGEHRQKVTLALDDEDVTRTIGAISRRTAGQSSWTGRRPLSRCTSTTRSPSMVRSWASRRVLPTARTRERC